MPEALHELLEVIERSLARCATEPQHPVTIRIFAVNQEDRHLVVEQEKPDGFPLSDLLRNKHVLTLSETLECLRPLAEAVQFTSDHRLPALDLTVSSILVAFVDSPTGESETTLVLKAPPLALTVLNQLSHLGEDGRTMLSDPLAIEPGRLEGQSIEQGILSLALLAFELLSGHPAPANPRESRPIAALSEAGNRCLRRAFEQNPPFEQTYDFVEELAGSA